MTRSSRPAALAITISLVMTMATPTAAQDEPVEPVPYTDAAGTQLGTLLVRDLADPFTAFEPTRPPAEGQRYALLTVVFEAAEDQAFPTDPRQVQLEDVDGNLYATAAVPRPADATPAEIQAQALNPFDRVSGVIGYVLPEPAEIVRIVYRGDGSRLLPVAELAPTGAVAVAEPRTFTDPAGVPLGSISVRGMTDPYAAFEPSRPPAEGQRYVLLDVAMEAAEDAAMLADPRVVALVDAHGFVYGPSGVPRPAGELLQDLELQPLSPGDRVSGAIGFSVPEAAEIRSVVYAPASNRVVPLVDL